MISQAMRYLSILFMSYKARYDKHIYCIKGPELSILFMSYAGALRSSILSISSVLSILFMSYLGQLVDWLWDQIQTFYSLYELPHAFLGGRSEEEKETFYSLYELH